MKAALTATEVLLARVRVAARRVVPQGGVRVMVAADGAPRVAVRVGAAEAAAATSRIAVAR